MAVGTQRKIQIFGTLDIIPTSMYTKTDHTYTYTYTCIGIFTHIYMLTHAHIHIHIHVHIHIYIHAYVHFRKPKAEPSVVTRGHYYMSSVGL